VDEFKEAFEVILKIEILLQESDVKEEKYEFLLHRAHVLIRDKREIGEVLNIIKRLCQLL